MLYFIIISTALVFSTCYKPLHFYGTNKRSADTTDMHQWVKLKGCWSVFAWLLHRNRRCALCLYNPIKLGRVLGVFDVIITIGVTSKFGKKICRFAVSVMVLADESFCHIWFILIYSKKRFMAKVIIKKAFTLQGSVYVYVHVRAMQSCKCREGWGRFLIALFLFFVNVSFQWMCVEDICFLRFS